MKDDLPVCIGMERSGSTVAWQIACLILGRDLEKTHEYVSGNTDCIYTFRNPVESYISLVEKFSDVYTVKLSKSHAMERIYSHVETFERLRKDASDGRKVLAVRYEEFYYNPEKRITSIASFLNKNISEEFIEKVLSKTSIKANLKVSANKNFGDIDGKTGLHGGHVNSKTLGEPLRNMSGYPDIDEIIQNKKIIELCKVFGYSLNNAGVAQLVERQPSKLNVVGSSPITRSS